jgi:cell wall assembly regulator SMI1
VTLAPEFEGNEPPSVEAVRSVEDRLGCALPSQYKAYMLAHDGGEGFVGEHYLIPWRIGQLVEFNKDYEVAKYAPGLLLFGSNGGGEAFAFDTRTTEKMTIRMVPFIGMSLQDAKVIADSFENFLACLAI